MSVEACTSCYLNLRQFLVISEDKDKLLDFLYRHRVLPMAMLCPECEKPMSLRDGRFFCLKRTIKINAHKKRMSIQCRCEVSQFKDTWFERTKIAHSDVCAMVALWITLRAPKTELICEEIGITQKTYIDWASFLREVCADHIFVGNCKKLGGKNKIVEIDEAKMGRSKYNKGQHIKGNWIFGALERGSRKCVLIPVASIGSVTLLNIIKTYIEPGTTIISDCWKSYSCLSNEDFIHLTVNHKYNFVDPETRAHTQNIERLWREVRSIVPRYGNKRKHLDGHLAEFLFRYKYPNYTARIHHIFIAIGELYKGAESTPQIDAENITPGLFPHPHGTDDSDHVDDSDQSDQTDDFDKINCKDDSNGGDSFQSDCWSISEAIPTKKELTGQTSSPKPFYSIETFLKKEGRVTLKIGADGNCFFRAVSMVLFGTEERHSDVREKIIALESSNETQFAQFIDSGNVKVHVRNMAKDKQWAETAEIYAAATLLVKDIYLFSPQPNDNTLYTWLLFKPLLNLNILEPLNITEHLCSYVTLCHTNGNHFDVIVPIQERCNCFLDNPKLEGHTTENDTIIV